MPLLLLAMVVFGLTDRVSASAQAARPTPPYFTSREDYTVTFPVPAGLFFCPSSRDAGLGHPGITLFLTKPKTCDRMQVVYGEAAVPRISVYYYRNEFPALQPDGIKRLPANNLEMLAQECNSPPIRPLPGLRLLGAEASGCLDKSGSHISLHIGSIYREYDWETGNPPDSVVVVTLDTIASRYPRDLIILRAIASALRVCSVWRDHAPPGRPACPPPLIAWGE